MGIEPPTYTSLALSCIPEERIPALHKSLKEQICFTQDNDRAKVRVVAYHPPKYLRLIVENFDVHFSYAVTWHKALSESNNLKGGVKNRHYFPAYVEFNKTRFGLGACLELSVV